MKNQLKFDGLSLLLFILLSIVTVFSFSSTFLGGNKISSAKAFQGASCPNPADNAKWYCAGECADLPIRNLFNGTYPPDGSDEWRNQKAANCSINPSQCQITTSCSVPSPTQQPTTPTPTQILQPTSYYKPITIDPKDPLSFLLGLLQLLGITTSTQNTAFPTPGIYPTIGLPPIVTGVPNQDIAAVIALANNITTYCGGYLDGSNLNCLDQFTLHPNAKFYIVNSVHFYYWEQCVDFVKALIAMTTGIMVPSVGNAINMFIYPPSGADYRFDRHLPSEGMPQPGDVAIWNYDTFGHAAFVVGNGDTAGTFKVTEANWDGKGGVRIHDKSISSAELMGFLRLVKL